MSHAGRRRAVLVVGMLAIGQHAYNQHRTCLHGQHAGHRPACCPCKQVHSCANMDSPAASESIPMKKWNSLQGGIQMLLQRASSDCGRSYDLWFPSVFLDALLSLIAAVTFLIKLTVDYCIYLSLTTAVFCVML